jgi:hypothetical protein
MLSNMGAICKICEKDGRLLPTHSFTNSSLGLETAMHYELGNNMNESIPLSSSVGKSNTRLDKPTGADSIVMTNLECSTWGLLAMSLSYLK